MMSVIIGSHLSSIQEVTKWTRNYTGLNPFPRAMGREGAASQPVLSPQADVNKGGWVGLQNLGEGFLSPFVEDSNQEKINLLWDL